MNSNKILHIIQAFLHINFFAPRFLAVKNKLPISNAKMKNDIWVFFTWRVYYG